MGAELQRVGGRLVDAGDLDVGVPGRLAVGQQRQAGDVEAVELRQPVATGHDLVELPAEEPAVEALGGFGVAL